MLTTVRAGIAVGLLAGFYILALGIIGGLGWATIALLQGGHSGAGKLGYLTIVLAIAIGAALWKVARAKPSPPDGVNVPEARAPQLWADVRGIASRVGTRAPDEIRLVAEVNAAVAEDAKLLGLRPGRRYLYIGTPLLHGLSVSQMRAVLAHELGHYSHSHTRLGPLSYRGRMAIIKTIEEVGPTSIAGYVFRGYARLYVLVQNSVSRRQEREADQAAVRIAGRHATASALRELEPIDAAWGFYLNNYVGWGLETGYAPAGVVARFSELLAGRNAELSRLRAEAPSAKRSWWDTHPPIAERVALIEREPDAQVPQDNRPATIMLPDLSALAAEVENATFDFRGRTRVPFEEYTARAAQAAAQRDADVLYRAAIRASGASGGTLGGVVNALVAGRRDALFAAMFSPRVLQNDPEGSARAFVEHLGAAISVALANTGAAAWRHSWQGAAVLVDRAGAPIDVEGMAAQLANEPAVSQARLTALGVDLTAAAASSAQATAQGADIVAAISDVRINKPYFDLLVLDNGLLFVPRQGKPSMEENAKPRLQALVRSGSPAEIAARPGTVFLAFEDVSAARMVKKIPLAFEVRKHDGGTVAWKHTLHSEELGEGIQEMVSHLAHAMPG